MIHRIDPTDNMRMNKKKWNKWGLQQIEHSDPPNMIWYYYLGDLADIRFPQETYLSKACGFLVLIFNPEICVYTSISKSFKYQTFKINLILQDNSISFPNENIKTEKEIYIYIYRERERSISRTGRSVRIGALATFFRCQNTGEMFLTTKKRR